LFKCINILTKIKYLETLTEQKSPKFSAAEADADSEVSQINTQNVNNTASMSDVRGLTASAVSSSDINTYVEITFFIFFTIVYKFYHNIDLI
jgi:hypothetical protein